MKIAAIKRNCAARTTARIYNVIGGRGQWISNGQSAFRVDGLRVDEDAVAALFDLSGNKRVNWFMGETIVTDPRFVREGFDGEEETDACGAQVWCDETYIALPTSRGLLFIPFEPVRHIKDTARRYAVRWSEGGRPLVAVYNGLLCDVLVLPLPDGDAETLQGFARRMTAPPYEWNETEAEGFTEAGDDEGEVME